MSDVYSNHLINSFLIISHSLHENAFIQLPDKKKTAKITANFTAFFMGHVKLKHLNGICLCSRNNSGQITLTDQESFFFFMRYDGQLTAHRLQLA